MTKYLNEAEFSLDPLSIYDPRDPAEMAQIILGAYAINARALEHSYEMIDAVISPDDLQYGTLRYVAGFPAGKNLDSVRGLLGDRLIQVSSRDDLSEPIKFKDITTEEIATGVPLSTTLQARNDVTKLRLYANAPNDTSYLPDFENRNDWWNVSLLDKSHEPLVDLEIIDAPVATLAATKARRWFRKLIGN